jgi:16S rRNA G966 N2-methylase RsmD
MGLRVIAGRAHGWQPDAPRGGRRRPPSGLVRGALFDMLEQQGQLVDVRILEPSAGGGALGIDAHRRHGETVMTLRARPEDAS